MADTRVRAQKATQLLRDDHKAVKQLFARIQKLDEDEIDEKRRLFDEIRRDLTIHATIEEEIFYPAIEGSGDEEARDLVDEAQEEHRIVRELLEELDGMEPGDAGFDAKLKVLSENVEHHADEEEKTVFEVFQRLPREKQDEVSEELRMRKLELSDDGEEPE